MTDTQKSIPSVAERTRPVSAGAPVVAVRFLGTAAAFVLGEEALMQVAKDGAERRTAIHAGAILAAASDGARVITGGDDGEVVATDAQGGSAVLATDQKRRWIDHVAAGPNGALAWSAGKQVFVRTDKGAERGALASEASGQRGYSISARAGHSPEPGSSARVLEVPSTVGGLAFAPKGFRLAVAHYNGATLWYPNAREAEPEKLEWKGSHLGASFSPDGKFLVTAMQEPTLHGWRLADRKDMRMSGYGVRVRSLGWTIGGKWLATSGSTQLILWPFQGNDGPMGKTPRLLAPTEAQVEVVACHPKQEVVAVGYADGLVLIVRIEDGAEILARKPGAAPVTALAWSAAGDMLAFGSEDGEAGVVDL